MEPDQNQHTRGVNPLGPGGDPGQFVIKDVVVVKPIPIESKTSSGCEISQVFLIRAK